jgi:hypothetical protein
MSARHTRPAALLATLMIALAILPAAALARPAGNGDGPRAAVSTKPSDLPSQSEPAPTVVRTIVKEDAVRVLPIALAGAALLIAIAGTGYAIRGVAPVRHQLRGEH